MEKQVERFQMLLEDKQFVQISQEAKEFIAADMAAILEQMDNEKMLRVFRLLPKDQAADVFAWLEADDQEYIILSLSEKEAGTIIDNLQSDDATDVLEEMPSNIVKRLLAHASPETRNDINHLLQYEDQSAGSIMTVEFVDLKEDMTVSQAIDKIRRVGVDSETINTCYVLTKQRILIGTVALRYLLMEKPDTKIVDFMNTNVIYTQTDVDQEEVAHIFQKYDFMALPVVDKERRMVGIITMDDILDIIEEETTEDMQRMAAIIPSDTPYLKHGIIDTWKKRIPWLLLLMISATFTGKIITSFEESLSKLVILTAYIPMLMDTGGNAGNQASTEVVRAISLHEVNFKDFFKVVWKELRVGILCGLTLAICNYLKLITIDHISGQVAFVICVTVLSAVIFSKLIASILTILVKRSGLDPAVVASPLLTTSIDAITLSIYFTVATTMLGI